MISHPFYSSQTLTTLDLQFNKIGAKGTQAIAQALTRNQVRFIFSFFISISHLFYSSQMLTTLTFNGNQIGTEGAHAIGQALERNQVG